MESITSLQNPKVKLAAHLREPRQRKKHQLTLVDGVREVRRALERGVSLHTLFVDAAWLANPEPISANDSNSFPDSRSFSDSTSGLDSQWVMELSHRLPVVAASSDIMAKIAFGDRASPLMAIMHTPSTSLSTLDALPTNIKPGLILVLDQIEKPGNLGAAARTADAVGATAMLLSDPLCEIFNPNAIRASLGAVFTIPVASGTALEIQTWLQQRGYQIMVARLDSSQDYASIDYRQETAFVVGNEAKGVSSSWSSPNMSGVRLPMLGIMDSLNASVTASVLLYEALRQRRSSMC